MVPQLFSFIGYCVALRLCTRSCTSFPSSLSPPLRWTTDRVLSWETSSTLPTPPTPSLATVVPCLCGSESRTQSFTPGYLSTGESGLSFHAFRRRLVDIFFSVVTGNEPIFNKIKLIYWISSSMIIMVDFMFKHYILKPFLDFGPIP